MTEAPAHGIVHINKLLFGGILPTEQMALEFATLVLKGLHGEAELLKQQPLRATDQGESWFVEGSYQEPGKEPGAFSWFIRVRKEDSRAEILGHRLPDDLSLA